MIASSRFADVENEPFSLQELARDTERRCVGDTHAEIIYKATETAVYKIGVAAAVDAKFPRSHFDSDMNFTMQWCARNPPHHPIHTHTSPPPPKATAACIGACAVLPPHHHHHRRLLKRPLPV